MSTSAQPQFSDLIGPPLVALPLTPVRLEYPKASTAVAQPSLPPHQAVPPILRPTRVGVRDWLDRMATELLRPFLLRSNPPSSNLIFLFLGGFFCWLGYWAVPDLPESLPAFSLRGAGYLALLLPASAFAASLFLAIGRCVGWLMERVASRAARWTPPSH